MSNSQYIVYRGMRPQAWRLVPGAWYLAPGTSYTRPMHRVATTSGKMQRVLMVSLAATFCYVIATFYFGLRAHSLALISEAGHNVSDMLAIALSFVAVFFQRQPATDQKTFGYQRAGVLAAFVNALTLIVLAAWIGISAIHRLYAPVAVQPDRK